MTNNEQDRAWLAVQMQRLKRDQAKRARRAKKREALILFAKHLGLYQAEHLGSAFFSPTRNSFKSFLHHIKWFLRGNKSIVWNIIPHAHTRTASSDAKGEYFYCQHCSYRKYKI